MNLAGSAPLRVYTVGHSTHPIEHFIDILAGHGVRRLEDVRTIPRSRRNPQFNRESLPASLQTAGIDYHHLPGLGGLRHPRKDSINTGWRNASFRGYADYMETPAFAENLSRLIELASAVPTAIMCAEAVPWRCHRSPSADALTARGIPVMEILGATKSQPHAITSFARVEGHQVTYPAKPNSVDLPPIPRAPDGKPDLSGVWDHPFVIDMSKDGRNGACGAQVKGCSQRADGRFP